MRVMVVGAYGLIGAHVVARLASDGHEVIAAGRDATALERQFRDMERVTVDLAKTSTSRWQELLSAVDAVVNCAGALQDCPRDDLYAVHVEGVRRLIEACRECRVRRFVHISAAGVGPGRATAFNDTKHEAELLIAASDLDWVVLRPGLVISQVAYGGTALLRGLAAFPFILPVAYPKSTVQIVSAEEVAEAVSIALVRDQVNRKSIDLVHPDAVAFNDLAVELRNWLGVKPAPVVSLPTSVVRITARLADALSLPGWRSPLRTTAVEQLRQGIAGNGEVAPRELGLRISSLAETLRHMPAGVQEHWFARTYFLKPAILGTLFLFWLLSGLIGLSAGHDPAIGVLAAAGMTPLPAQAAVIGGSIVDIALALGVIVRRSAPLALKGMIAVSITYMIGGAILRPDLWLDPLGPFLKTIPATMLCLVALAIMDDR